MTGWRTTTVALVLACLSELAAAQQVEQVGNAEFEAMVKTTTSGLAVHPVFRDKVSTALVVRRTSSGEVERHAKMNDIMMVRAGQVRLLIGGRVQGGRSTSPGEWRGGRILGGETRTLQPGDMLWIPAGIPHQMILPHDGSFTYIAIKIPTP